jgi:hypothetical protein
MLHHPWITMFQRRSSVRIVYTRSNSLMELMPPEAAAAVAAAGEAEYGGQGGRRGAGGAVAGRSLQPSVSAQRRGSALGYDTGSPPSGGRSAGGSGNGSIAAMMGIGGSGGGSGGGGGSMHLTPSPPSGSSPRLDPTRVRSRLAPH